jgi:CheY-like chemotaxis protein
MKILSGGKSLIRILIVDDDPSTRFVLRLILEREGHEIIEASDGVKALEILSSDPLPDIVTSDLMMPMMSGFELVHRLRSEARTLAVPIVVVTSNPDAALSLASAGLVSSIVSKPFTAASFVESIREVARNKSGRTLLEAH